MQIILFANFTLKKTDFVDRSRRRAYTYLEQFIFHFTTVKHLLIALTTVTDGTGCLSIIALPVFQFLAFHCVSQ